jgi:initiation factor 1A
MVLNAGGGNKGKGVARKFVMQHTGGAKTVRLAQAEGETYAIVKQLLGNCMCSVICSDGYKRLCIIRKKFTGRRKADNNVMGGTVVLVGLHDYGNGSKSAASAAAASGALKCDLLYVYGDQEREKLRKACDLSKLNAALGCAVDTTSAGPDDNSIKFVSSGTGVFNKYATEDSRKNVRTVATLSALHDDEKIAGSRQTTILGNQWIGEDMLPSDDEDECDDKGKDEEEDEEDEEDEDEDEDEDDQQQQQQQQQHSRNKQQRSNAPIINVDDI